ncbi:Zn(II)2Cys6 transcription factor [Aspergillus mulundensis]|uniref:Putative C6 transcription factor n=1 Tax=Aspergillus mulundensis TaxID=1810919 RepID=A0A3D8S3Z6_9EURO|nr:putative C6 transcription factor [Aspergillus mulundensis]RDW81022.1 putative C6 transcription factor [Aspergillus mulundensis]
MSAPSRPRKRTKTFTGCWTCRGRKIKCDEGKPSCRQCADKGLSCEGYSARLQWLLPATGASVLYTDDLPEASTARSLRRLLPVESPKTILDIDQVDGILRYLDSLELVVDSSGDQASASIQNFGVFSLAQGPCQVQVENISSITKDHQLQHGNELIFDESALIPSDHSSDNPEAEAAWNLCNLHEQDLPLDFLYQEDLATADLTLDTETISSSEIAGNSSHWQPFEPDLALPVDGNDSLINEPQQAYPHPTNTLVSLSVPSQERFLMGHYMTRVVNLFCVIENAKSPWKTIHLPRVLQCAGELSFGGSTTRIRNALSKCLLSVSAFYLSNDHRAHHRHEDAENWGTVASRYRCDAIGLLKHAVETDLYAERKPKYKEFLATMLSMVTINVMSGDTSTCSVHLDGAEKLISHMSARKSTFSRKAQSLHRICFYLRVLYESTAVRIPRSGVSRFSSSLGSPIFGPQLIVPRRQIYFDDDESPSSVIPMPGDKYTLAAEVPQTEMSAYECIYGIPQSLLILLKDSIELIDELNSHSLNGTNPPGFIPEVLAPICDDLEQKILDWPLEDRLHLCNEPCNGNSTSATIIYHQTRAFLNALIIFFSQSVRMLGHRYLRQYVQAILESIEEIEQLKAETKILAAPLFWPAFMGATEAFEPRQQERFRQWYARVKVYGIEAVRTGIQVVHEVWRLGPTSASTANRNRQMFSGWRGVIQRRGDCLMLT